MKDSIGARVLASLTVLLAGTVQAQDERGIFDRAPYYQDRPNTTDDVQRIPVPAGYNEPAGSFVLVGGRVMDGKGGEPRAATVVVEGKKITAILPAGAAEWPKESHLRRSIRSTCAAFR
jgi:hypothetical protein